MKNKIDPEDKISSMNDHNMTKIKLDLDIYHSNNDLEYYQNP